MTDPASPVSTEDLERRVAAQYSRADLANAILDALAKTGADPEAPTIDELAPVDEFHTGGRITTVKALQLVPITSDMHVLDAGCGIGGTARYLAGELGCRVTGIDLTPDYIRVAQALTERVGLSGQCDFHQGSVLEMPFAEGSFDAAVSFHVAMNIENRAGFYTELARILKPGAPLCIFDVMKGPEAGLVCPVPWAEVEASSFLFSSAQTKALLEEAGFAIETEENLRSFAQTFLEEIAAKVAAAGEPPPVGPHLLTGANSPEKFSNYLKALQNDQVEPVILAAKRR
jgi:ubiquinone/menaquinone biosynthesis C-methylase UbiE